MLGRQPADLGVDLGLAGGVLGGKATVGLDAADPARDAEPLGQELHEPLVDVVDLTAEQYESVAEELQIIRASLL